MRTIYLARHGQTEGNRDGIVLGRTDSPLTPEGTSVVKDLAVRMIDEPVRVIIASPLGRALATAGIYAERLKTKIVVQEAMAELGCGSWEGLPRVQVAGDRPKIRMGWDDRPPGGESYLDGEARVRAFVREVNDMSADGALLVIGHAAVNRVFLKLFLGLQPETAMRIRSLHGIVYMVDPEGKVRRRSATGPDEVGLSLEDEQP